MDGTPTSEIPLLTTAFKSLYLTSGSGIPGAIFKPDLLHNLLLEDYLHAAYSLPL
jgi:hypothetical protein